MVHRSVTRLTDFARRLWSGVASADVAPVESVDPAVVGMLRTFGIAMLETGQATNEVEETLYRIAAAYGAGQMRVVVLPTVIIIQVEGTAATTELDSVSGPAMRLDQTGAIATLVAAAARGELEPVEAVRALARVRSSEPRFGPWTSVLGHTVLSLGFGLSLNPTLAAVPAYVVLGATVGVLLLLGRRLPTLGTALPVVAAFTITVITGAFLADAVGDDPLRVLAPPLVSFLPGLTLTIAAVELTSDQIVAGASRVVYGIAQLLLLAFGVVAGVAVVGNLSPVTAGEPLGAWAPWLGVLLVAVGYLLFSSAPPGSFWWLALTLYVAFAAQSLGGVLLSPELSGFLGALVVVPFTRWVARFRSAPPAVVTMIPAFWLLVPGALGFIGISSAARGAASLGVLVDTGLALFSIALGMLVGTGLTRDLSMVRSTWRQVS